MPLLIKRLVIVGSLLFAGHLGIAGTAGSEPDPYSVHDPRDEAADSEEVRATSLGDSPDSIAFELGLTSPVKRQAEAVSSDAPTLEDYQADPRPPGTPAAPPAVSAAAPYPVHERPEVRHFVDRFQTGYRRAVVERWLSRSGRYAEMIREILVQQGLPEELIFTAMIESGFNPLAVSRAGAKGLWQFMASTARRYGLRVDRWLDERLDPEKSTWAAANYLRDLYAMFGSWHLVQAAYNAGEMRVARAIQGTRTSDFWQLSRSPLLAEETKSFVAAIQAAAIIGREPDRYGFSVTLDDPLRYDVIRVPPFTSLKKIGALAGLPDGELQLLNPALRLAQTPPGEAYALKVPSGTADKVTAALHRHAGAGPVVAARTPRDAATGKPAAARVASRGIHVVKPQETVRGIARHYGVSPAEIVRWNQLSDAARIFPGDRLRVASLGPGRRAAEQEDGQGGFR